nr:conserved hypothetical protein [Ipomoea batatas]
MKVKGLGNPSNGLANKKFGKPVRQPRDHNPWLGTILHGSTLQGSMNSRIQRYEPIEQILFKGKNRMGISVLILADSNSRLQHFLEYNVFSSDQLLIISSGTFPKSCRVFLFQFSFHEVDVKRIAEDGPWSFEQSLLVVKHADRFCTKLFEGGEIVELQML